MLKKILIAVLFLAILSSLPSCKSSQRNVTTTLPDRLDNTLLWEFQGKGMKKPSYIFGTIHMIGAEDFSISSGVEDAIDASKKMVMEIDLSQMLATSMKTLSLAPMKDGKKLKNLITEEDYKIVKTYFTKETKSKELKVLPFETIENWKPMLLQSFLYQDMIEGPVKAYEMELFAMGKKEKMTFGGLETIEDQIAVFEKIPYKDQAVALVEMVKQIKSGKNAGKTEFMKLVEVYKSQDIDGMVDMSGEQFDELENGEEELLIKRNTKWIPLMIEMAKKQPTFFAVGAAHLGGPHGVIRLLMKEGYTLKPLKN